MLRIDSQNYWINSPEWIGNLFSHFLEWSSNRELQKTNKGAFSRHFFNLSTQIFQTTERIKKRTNIQGMQQKLTVAQDIIFILNVSSLFQFLDLA